MLNIVWFLAAVSTDIETSIITDSALIGAEESTISGSLLGEGSALQCLWLAPFQKCTSQSLQDIISARYSLFYMAAMFIE